MLPLLEIAEYVTAGLSVVHAAQSVVRRLGRRLADRQLTARLAVRTSVQSAGVAEVLQNVAPGCLASYLAPDGSILIVYRIQPQQPSHGNGEEYGLW